MSSLHTNQNFIGLDLFHSPPDLAPPMLTQADNLLIEGGSLVTRPGFVGLLAAAFGAAIYSPFAWLDTDGTTKIVFVSGGRLYKWVKGTSAAVEIVITGVSGTINGPGSRIVRLGHYGYLVDGVLALVRFDLTGGKLAPNLAQPAPAPAAALTSTALDSLLTGTWTADALTGAGQINRLPNANFATTVAGGGWGAGGGPSGYTPIGANPDIGTPTAETGNWLLLDNPQEGAVNTAVLLNDVISTDAARQAKNFYAAITCHQGDPTGLSSVILTLQCYSDAAGTVPLIELSREFTVPYSGNQSSVTLDVVLSAASLSVEVLSYRLRVLAGNHNADVVGTSGQPSLYVQQPVAFPFTAALTASVMGTQLEVQQPQSLAYTGGAAIVSQSGTVGMGRGAGGQHLTRDYGSAQDWHTFDHLAVSLSKALGITQDGTAPLQPGPVLRLAFRQNGSAVRYYTNPMTISADGTYAGVDISTVPLAVRSAFRYLEIVLGGQFTAPAANGSDLLLLGPITGAGNLGTGYAYYWAYVEVDPSGDPLLTNIIQSNASALSNTLTGTLTQAEASLTLPTVPTNAAATMLYVYRFGGATSDGIGRLITKRKFTDTVAYGADAGQAGSLLNRPNPYISYAGATLIDNTPDLFLLGQEALVAGRDAPPVGASSICAWQARLWLGKSGNVYGSWAVTLDTQNALYFTSANLSADPLARIKGFTFSVGQDDNDGVQNLLPIATNAFFSKGFLGILKQHSVWLLSGTDPSNFAIQSYLIGSGRGCVAPRGACLVEGQIWYTRSDGISSFDGDSPSNQSQLVEALLRPAPGQVQQVAAAFAASAMAYHGRRVYAFVPIPGAALSTSCLVYDTRQQGWTRLLTPFGVTGAASGSAQTDNDDLYLAGADGQLYQVTGQADQALSGSAGAAITFAAKSRGFGQEGGGEERWHMNTASRASVQAASAAGFMGTLTLATEAGAFWTQAYTFAAGTTGPRLRVPPGIKGVYHLLGFSGSVLVRTFINSLALESAEVGVTQ